MLLCFTPSTNPLSGREKAEVKVGPCLEDSLKPFRNHRFLPMEAGIYAMLGERLVSAYGLDPSG